jgi:hypothetical protein
MSDQTMPSPPKQDPAPDLTAPTQWLDANGTPLMMSPGKIWVQMVPPSTKMDY